MFHSELDEQRQLVAMLQRHFDAVSRSIGNWRAETMATIDANCDCDNCLGLEMLVQKADDLIQEFQRTIAWMSGGPSSCPMGPKLAWTSSTIFCLRT